MFNKILAPILKQTLKAILAGIFEHLIQHFVATGGAFVPGVKRIMISLPEKLLKEVDDLASIEQRNRSEFIREAMKLYISERKKRTLREQMKKGYQEMADINLALAVENYEIESEVQNYYENKLAECK